MLTTKELFEQTGISERQLYHWVNKEVISDEFLLNGRNPGSGYQLLFDEKIIPRINLLVKLSKWSGTPNVRNTKVSGGLPTHVLKEIFWGYHIGILHIAPGLVLAWTVEEDNGATTDASPADGSRPAG